MFIFGMNEREECVIVLLSYTITLMDKKSTHHPFIVRECVEANRVASGLVLVHPDRP